MPSSAKTAPCVPDKAVSSTGCAKVPLAPPVRVGRLDTLPRLRRELGRLYRDSRSGRIDAQSAARLASILAIMARLIEGSEFEERLARLEEGGDR